MSNFIEKARVSMLSQGKMSDEDVFKVVEKLKNYVEYDYGKPIDYLFFINKKLSKKEIIQLELIDKALNKDDFLITIETLNSYIKNNHIKLKPRIKIILYYKLIDHIYNNYMRELYYKELVKTQNGAKSHNLKSVMSLKRIIKKDIDHLFCKFIIKHKLN